MSEESNYHFFFSFSLANALWSWLPAPCGSTKLAPTSATALSEAISLGGNVSARQLTIDVFFYAISIFWLLRNDSKHNGPKSTIEHAKVIFVDKIRGMILFLATVKVQIYHHPILVFLGMP